MTSLAPIVPCLGQLIRLLSSDRDGDVVAAARAIGRTLKSAGRDFHDLADAIEHPHSPRRAHRSTNASKWAYLSSEHQQEFLDLPVDLPWLRPWEREFAASVRAQFARHGGTRFSAKQRAVLDRLLARLWAWAEARP